MSKTAMIRSRIEPDLKKQVEIILNELGLSTTQAIGLYYKQILMNQGIPFDVKIPNAITKKTFENTDKKEEVITVKSKKELFNELDL